MLSKHCQNLVAQPLSKPLQNYQNWEIYTTLIKIWIFLPLPKSFLVSHLPTHTPMPMELQIFFVSIIFPFGIVHIHGIVEYISSYFHLMFSGFICVIAGIGRYFCCQIALNCIYMIGYSVLLFILNFIFWIFPLFNIFVNIIINENIPFWMCHYLFIYLMLRS